MSWASGQIVATPGLQRNIALFLEHLDQLRRRYGHYRVIHVICDNARFHQAAHSKAVQEYLQVWGERTIELASRDPVRRWVDDLCDLFHGPGPMDELTAGALLLTVLSRLDRLEDRKNAAAQVHPLVQRAIEVIERNLQTSLDAATLARQAHVSVSHLTALFRHHLGCGPVTYHRRMRLQYASRLLRNPRYRMSEVANLCGFDDVNYFVRLFRGEFGQSPGRWRRGQ